MKLILLLIISIILFSNVVFSQLFNIFNFENNHCLTTPELLLDECQLLNSSLPMCKGYMRVTHVIGSTYEFSIFNTSTPLCGQVNRKAGSNFTCDSSNENVKQNYTGFTVTCIKTNDDNQSSLSSKTQQTTFFTVLLLSLALISFYF
ncbi:hypothetical protein RB653_008518 [Dictyostelium firmibasis]|uniref:Transmembrane protein n=1 Tax=Dictyostelium firmibasis TaxID=79012 RepID=A0AAN7TSQ2_9MYCE